MDCNPPGSSVHGISGKNTGVANPFPGYLPDPGIEPMSSSLQADSLLSESPGKPCQVKFNYIWKVRKILKHYFNFHLEMFYEQTCFQQGDRWSMCVYALSHVRIFCDRIDCSLPGFSIYGIFHVKTQGSSWPRDQTCFSCISCTDRQILYHCTTWVDVSGR